MSRARDVPRDILTRMSKWLRDIPYHYRNTSTMRHTLLFFTLYITAVFSAWSGNVQLFTRKNEGVIVGQFWGLTTSNSSSYTFKATVVNNNGRDELGLQAGPEFFNAFVTSFGWGYSGLQIMEQKQSQFSTFYLGSSGKFNTLVAAYQGQYVTAREDGVIAAEGKDGNERNLFTIKHVWNKW